MFSRIDTAIAGMTRRQTWLALMLFLMSSSAHATELQESNALHAEQWEIARADASVRSIEALVKTQRLWSQNPAQRIELQYPGGEEGELWVSELSSWLVALGIPSSRLVAVPGSGTADVIHLRVIQSGDSFR